MATSVFILCAGEARRFNGVHKQLLQIRNECILERIIRQCRDRGIEPTVVSHHEVFRNVDCRLIVPEVHRYTDETFLSTQYLWNERTIILLGDVVYSKFAMDMVFADCKPVRVFGDQWEMFAVCFAESHWVKVVSALEHAIDVAVETGVNGQGKIRKFYQSLCGLPLDTNTAEKEVEIYQNDHLRVGSYPYDTIFYYVDDWTQDVDSHEDYTALLRQKVGQNVLDDLPESK